MSTNGNEKEKFLEFLNQLNSSNKVKLTQDELINIYIFI